MNDDFLNRLRKAPPPEFLKELKARLERQPPLPPVRRRSGFGRGLVVGILVTALSFATASVSITGWPTSPRQFFSAPVEYLAQSIKHRDESGQGEDQTHVKAVPLGPAWFPTHVNAQPASANDVDRSSASAAAAPPAAPAGANTTSTQPVSADSAGARATASGAIAKSFGLQLGVQRQLDAFARSNSSSARVVVNLVQLTDNTVFAGLCGSVNDINSLPHIIETTHRITSNPACTTARPYDIMELKLGYLAAVLARSRLYAPMNLSAHELFLALARRVPDPTHAGRIIDNPYTTWNEINPALPYDSIQFYGPPPNSPEGRLAAALLLDEGCDTFRNTPSFEQSCREMRTDSHYSDGAGRGNLWEVLNITPTALGIVSLNNFQAVQTNFNANPIDGVAPDYAAIAARHYPASAAIYMYAASYNFRSQYPTSIKQLVLDAISPDSANRRAYDSVWGFVQLDEAESAVTHAWMEARKTVQF